MLAILQASAVASGGDGDRILLAARRECKGNQNSVEP